MIIIEEAPNYGYENGNVYNLKTNKCIKPVITGSGYPVVRLRNNGAYVNLSMHRLVAKYELGVVGQVIEHINDNKQDYSPQNLKASTQVNNITKALGKPVVGFNGKVYKHFDSIAAAARFVNCEPSRIAAICRGKIGYKTAGGYTWSYDLKAGDI